MVILQILAQVTVCSLFFTQVAMTDAVSAMDDASVAPDLSTEGITPMETDNSAAAAPAE